MQYEKPTTNEKKSRKTLVKKLKSKAKSLITKDFLIHLDKTPYFGYFATVPCRLERWCHPVSCMFSTSHIDTKASILTQQYHGGPLLVRTVN